MRRVVCLIAIIVVLAIIAADASAYAGGRFQASGRQGSNCSQCHSGSGGTIIYTFAPLNMAYPPIGDGYVPGATYDVTLTISGGPGVQWGFAWDSDGGFGTVTDPTNTKVNTDPGLPANFTFTRTGNDQNTWGFQWTAPTDGTTVSFWGAGASTNGSGSGGDAPTTTLMMQADPAPEYLCRIGNVNAAGGSITDVLFVNSSAGVGPERALTIGQFDPLTIEMVEPPSNPGGPARFVLYFHRNAPTPSTVRVLPAGLGLFCKPIFLTDSDPANLIKLTNNIGKPSRLGVSDFPSTPAPSTVVSKPGGVGVTLTIFTQGLIFDSLSPHGQAAVTNGVQVTFVP